MNIIPHRNIFLTIAVALVVASIAAIAFFGLPLGIDFTGGSLLQVTYITERPQASQVREVLKDISLGDVTVQPTQDNGFLLRFKEINEETHQDVLGALETTGEIQEERFESIGPVVGSELKRKAITALIIVIILVIIYIAWAFRKVSYPVSSWKYGMAAIAALIHDIVIPTGVVSILGAYYAFQVDAFFITALLTILGFSIHDTIIVFDRIRENIRRRGGEDFSAIAEQSVKEVMGRSINTSLTLLFVLLAVLFLGGPTTKNLALVLVLGIISGTYSSIFVASPLLTLWAGKTNS